MYNNDDVFRPRISDDLNKWRLGWNNHGIRTENYQSPLQLFISGAIANVPSSHTFRMDAVQRENCINNFRTQHQLDKPEDIGIVLDRITPPINDVELEELRTLVPPSSFNQWRTRSLWNCRQFCKAMYAKLGNYSL